MEETGVVVGCFQVLHLGHMEYILAAKMRCKKLYIGVDRPDETERALTYYERVEMIRESLADFNVPVSDYEIVPFPSDRPETIFAFVPQDATYYVTSYDDVEDERARLIREKGCKIETLWNRSADSKTASSTEVRRRISAGESYREFVPASVLRYMQEHDLEKRFAIEEEAGETALNADASSDDEDAYDKKDGAAAEEKDNEKAAASDGKEPEFGEMEQLKLPV